jgi:16S rRNA (cytidine1402-2'-O)-methyltransferase
VAGTAAVTDWATAAWPEAVVPGALHVVSTPIGHLGDITLRGLAVLRQAALICCEDTRHTRPLLDRYGITTPTQSLHEHNEARVIPGLLERLRSGEAVALVSDAGTPLVSDPGQRAVEAVVRAGGRVVPIPGPSATLAALVASGLPALPFTMLGFLPRKGRERQDQLALAAGLPHTVVLFEAPGRVADTLRDLAAMAGEARPVVVARELTKHFEELRRGTLAEVAAYAEQVPPRGEVVLVLGGAPPVEAPDEEALEGLAAGWRAEGVPPRELQRRLVELHGASRNLAYRLAHSR